MRKVVLVFLLILVISTFSSIKTVMGISEKKDQHQEYSETSEHVDTYWISWQEFVPTVDNLSRVEVKIVRYELYPNEYSITMTIEKPLGNVLTSKTLQWVDVPEGSWYETVWISFDVPDIPLTPGQSYYIVLDSEPLAYLWGAVDWDAYPPGGSNFEYTWDWAFRTFYLAEAGPAPPVQLTFNTIHDWSPSITYTGQWFASETASDEIFVGPFDGSELPSLITADGNHPQIGDYGTPEGDWVVVYTRYYPPPDPQADIYLYDNYNAMEEQVTTTSWSDTWPSISRREAYSHLVVFNSYLGLTSELCGAEPTEPHTFYQLTYDTPFSGWPSQSSGGKIAFNTIPEGETPTDHEIAVYYDGSIIRLTYNTIDDYGPSISDDGSRVVWYDADNKIWAGLTDGSYMSQIANGWDPEISGDGKWVVFVDDRTGDNEIYMVSWNKGEAGGVWDLSNDSADDNSPSISSLTSDGGYHIVWSSNRASDYEIWGSTFFPPLPPVPVGGVVIPVDKFGLLVPYIALAVAIVAITIGVMYAKKRWLGKAVVPRP